MSVFVLKLIAVLTMLVDHGGILLSRYSLISRDLYLLMRTVGRFAFPIYCFLLAEGYRHLKQDRQRLLRHVLMLVVLFAVSEPLFDRFLTGQLRSMEHQSVILTLLLGFVGLLLSEPYRGKPLARGGILLLCALPGWLLSSDYGLAGVLLVYFSALYLDRMEFWNYGRRFLGCLAVILAYYTIYLWTACGFGSPAATWRYFLAMDVYNLPHLVLVPLLAAYQGRLGRRNRVLHRCYQWFYPAHLAAFWLISLLLK